MKKGFIYLVAGIIAICAAVLIIRSRKPFSEKKNTYIVEKTVKKNGKVIARYKIAELPPEQNQIKKQMDTLEGTVVIVPNNPPDINSKMMVAIEKDKEIIAVTNPEYVRTLGYLYFGKKVSLKGYWQSNAIIFGRKYRSFRIEDISLAKS